MNFALKVIKPLVAYLYSFCKELLICNWPGGKMALKLKILITLISEVHFALPLTYQPIFVPKSAWDATDKESFFMETFIECASMCQATGQNAMFQYFRGTKECVRLMLQQEDLTFAMVSHGESDATMVHVISERARNS